MKRHLIIVETPDKKKSLQKILGGNYDVVHIDALPQKHVMHPQDMFLEDSTTQGNSFRIENLSSLREKLEKYDRIYIATDPGERGEALALQLKMDLAQGKKLARMVLPEISRRAVYASIKNPSAFNKPAAEAFVARRTINHVFNEEMTIFLRSRAGITWSSGLHGLAVLKLLSDRDESIRMFESDRKTNISLKLQWRQKSYFAAQLVKINGQSSDVPHNQFFKALVYDLKAQEMRVRQIDHDLVYETPPTPYKTSTLLSDAMRLLGFSFSKTLQIAQQLYSGVKLSEKTFSGLITFYLTNSDKIRSGRTEIRELVLEDFGKLFLPNLNGDDENKIIDKMRDGAIQPLYIRKTPKKLKKHLTEDQFQLYSLIWKRTMASQMVSAAYENTVVQIGSGENDRYQLEARKHAKITRGFRMAYSPEPDTQDHTLSAALPSELRVGEVLQLKDAVHFDQKEEAPLYLTEADLIAQADKEGVNSIHYMGNALSDLSKQKLISRQGDCLTLTKLGRDVCTICREQLPQLFTIRFVSTIEKEFESLKNGAIDFQTCITNFYKPFQAALKEPGQAPGSAKAGPGEPQVLDEKCEQCGRNLIVRVGKFGRFVACSGYPECHFSRPYFVGVKCPSYGCDGEVVERLTKKGRLFYGCSNYPKCNFASWQKPENIVCPNCGNLYLVIKEEVGYSKIYQCPQCKTEFDDDLARIDNKKNLFAKVNI